MNESVEVYVKNSYFFCILQAETKYNELIDISQFLKMGQNWEIMLQTWHHIFSWF